MKILERVALVLFSIIMLVISITLGLAIFNIIELKPIYNLIDELIEMQTARRIILGSCIVSIILAIKALFFPTRIKRQQEIKSGVLLENNDGRLLISKDTIENLVNSVVRNFDQAVDVQTKVALDAENSITVFVSLLVKENSIINELSLNIQNSIKETIKKSTDLNVKQVNINVKDIDKTKKDNVNQSKDINKSKKDLLN